MGFGRVIKKEMIRSFSIIVGPWTPPNDGPRFRGLQPAELDLETVLIAERTDIRTGEPLARGRVLGVDGATAMGQGARRARFGSLGLSSGRILEISPAVTARRPTVSSM